MVHGMHVLGTDGYLTSGPCVVRDDGRVQDNGRTEGWKSYFVVWLPIFGSEDRIVARRDGSVLFESPTGSIEITEVPYPRTYGTYMIATEEKRFEDIAHAMLLRELGCLEDGEIAPFERLEPI